MRFFSSHKNGVGRCCLVCFFWLKHVILSGVKLLKGCSFG